MLDPSAYTLMPNGGGGGSGPNSPSPTRGTPAVATTGGTLSPRPHSSSGGIGGTRYIVQDSRWRFVTEDKFPVVRGFQGGIKRYRAGRGSSVPLDLSLLG